MTRDQRISDDARPSTDDIAAASHTDRDDVDTVTGHDEARDSEDTRLGSDWSRDTDRTDMDGTDMNGTGTDRTRETDDLTDDLNDDRLTDSDEADDLADADQTGDADRTEQSGWRDTGHSMDHGRDVAVDEETRSGDWAGAHRADERAGADPFDTGSDGMAGADRTTGTGWSDTRSDLDTDQGQVDNGDAADLTDGQASKQSAPRASGDDESPAELFQPEMVERFRGEWQRIQGRFVDDPQDAVRGADHLVAEVMQALATMFSEHKHELEGQWQQRSEAETEDLRLALRRYRSFFNQLLNA